MKKRLHCVANPLLKVILFLQRARKFLGFIYYAIYWYLLKQPFLQIPRTEQFLKNTTQIVSFKISLSLLIRSFQTWISSRLRGKRVISPKISRNAPCSHAMRFLGCFPVGAAFLRQIEFYLNKISWQKMCTVTWNRFPIRNIYWLIRQRHLAEADYVTD